MIFSLYDILLWLLFPFITAYHLYRSLSRKRPPALAARFGRVEEAELAAIEGQRPIWIHSVSVGETIAARPFLKALKKRFPHRRIVLSNVTETGRSVARSFPEIDLCLYFPFDYRFAVRKLLQRVNPALIIVVETEIWPNFLREAKGQGIPLMLINGRISDRSFPRYLKLHWFFSRVLPLFDRLCMQTAEDARRISGIGAPAGKVSVAGNLKYDIPAMEPTPEEKAAKRSSFKIPAGLTVVTVGSTHGGEEETILASFRQASRDLPGLLLVLVPRHPERVPQVRELLRAGNVPFTLRSELDRRPAPFKAGEVLLVDTVGELMQFYAIADFSFVGGSLVPVGGHNILEPASLGVPVLFGPHMSNFRESAEMILASGGGAMVRDLEELTAAAVRLGTSHELRASMGKGGISLLRANAGATERTLQTVEQLLEPA